MIYLDDDFKKAKKGLLTVSIISIIISLGGYSLGNSSNILFGSWNLTRPIIIPILLTLIHLYQLVMFRLRWNSESIKLNRELGLSPFNSEDNLEKLEEKSDQLQRGLVSKATSIYEMLLRTKGSKKLPDNLLRTDKDRLFRNLNDYLINEFDALYDFRNDSSLDPKESIKEVIEFYQESARMKSLNDAINATKLQPKIRTQEKLLDYYIPLSIGLLSWILMLTYCFIESLLFIN